MRLLLALAIVCAFVVSLRADVVEMRNGDRLSGVVVSQSETEVVLDHPYLGKLKLPMAKVKAVVLDSEDGDVPEVSPPKPTTPPKPAAKTGEADLQTKVVGQVVKDPTLPLDAQPSKKAQAPASAKKPPTGKPAAKPPAPKVALDPQKAGQSKPVKKPSMLSRILKEWDSKLQVGLNGSGGERDTQNIYVRFSTTNQKGRNRWQASGQYFLGRSNGKTTRSQAQAQVTRDWLKANSNWFLFGRGEYKYDEFRAWEHRASAYGGGGYVFVDDKKFKVSARAGLGGTYEFGQIDKWTPEAFFSGTAAQWNLTKNQVLAGELTYYPSLNALDDYRVQGKVWWQYKLSVQDGLSLRIGADDEYDSTPDRRDGRHDFKYYGAIVFEF
jgi:putative salt-induced outer membrane protein YdiY